MTSVAITMDNDLFLDARGNLAFVTGAQAIAQDTRTAMSAMLGEMQYAVDRGMPMRATAFDRYNAAQFEAAARAVILAVPGVVSVNEFRAVLNGNTLDYTATISTTEGVLNV